MKKLALVLAFLIGSVASAFAACTSPAVMHDFPGTSFNMSLATVPDGNCGSNIAIPTWAGGTLGAMANYGTSPGAVLVPGVNAFVTSLPAVQGAVSNASSGVATGSISVPTISYLYGFNGTTWDQVSIGTYGTAPGAVKAVNTNAAITNTPSVNISQIAGSSVVGDPCQLNTHTFTPISISSAVNTKIVTGTALKKTYICHLYLFGAAADNVGIVEGTGVNCATGTAGVIGGATAATGINLVANQGWVEGSGSNAIAATATNADDFCLITSSAAQLSGVAVTVQQ